MGNRLTEYEIYVQEKKRERLYHYSGPEWEALRLYTLQRCKSLCEKCEQLGIYTLATEVDHVLPVRTHPHLLHDKTNLKGVCKKCHYLKTKMEMRYNKMSDKDKRTYSPADFYTDIY